MQIATVIVQMLVGLLQLELAIPGAESLKDRRRVVKSLKDRLHRDHLVSVAEIGPAEPASRALLAVACVGTDRQRLAQVLDRVLDRVRSRTDAELVGSGRDIGEPGQLLAGLDELDEEAIARELLNYADSPSRGDDS